MPNTNPTTGLAYGVISFNSLQPWCLDDLFYGDQAKDLSYALAIDELVREAEAEYESLMEECCMSAAESGADREADFEFERFQENWFAFRNQEPEKDSFVDERVERRREHIGISEPIIEGVYDGVTYRISWLGGAPLLLVFDGPHTTRAQPCSPCVPGAGSLDSLDPAGIECYDVPKSWRWRDGEST